MLGVILAVGVAGAVLVPWAAWKFALGPLFKTFDVFLKSWDSHGG